VDVAEMVSGCAQRVTVVQACNESTALNLGDVGYRFLAPAPGQCTISTGIRFAQLIRGLQADVFHVNGLSFPNDVIELAALAPETPIFLQDHADRVPGFWRRRTHRRGMSAAAGVSFCSLQQAQPFIEAGLISPDTRLFQIAEASSRFTPGDRACARAATGLFGDPALLWVGHLNENKDPLTVLTGVSQAVRTLPNLQLWCCFGAAPLMSRVRQRIAEDDRLRNRVHLLGWTCHGRVEQLMRAADIFVLGSHREGSGYSLIEALACGLPPVVTDIASFRSLTGAGAAGALWACGKAETLTKALLSVAAQPQAAARAATRTHFDKTLAFDALGRQLVAAYQELSECR
jgi:glycosyltransferase involved in cell wall biosynthesis